MIDWKWIGLLLIVAVAPAKAAEEIIGQYRFGHEVNTVCTGEPELCYWLVDTAAEVRQELKAAVAGLEPYAPACLRLNVEISSERADGFGADYDGSIRVLEVLGPCENGGGETAMTLDDLQHRRWILVEFDGVTLPDLAVELGFDEAERAHKVPDLDFGDQGYVAGNTGCNQFQGQAQVVDNQLLLTGLATTLMACAGFAGELELRLQMAYRQPLDLSLEGNDLVLGAGEEVLHYKPRDWVQ